MSKKLKKDIRKDEILNAAKKIFLKKGFSKTTMEDVIAETSLSKGGVYYYYKNTKEMIFDIFIEGNNYRIGIIKKYIEKNNLTASDLKDANITAELITDKVLDVSPLMEIYAQFLIEAMYDDELCKIYNEIVQKSREEFIRLSPDNFPENIAKIDSEYEFITNIINTFIIGSNILKANRNFNENRFIIKEMIRVAIESFESR